MILEGDLLSLGELFPLQKDLDEEIASIHHIDYPSTFQRRLLSFLVELGEFANETRCFKYWSNKGASPKEIILDEYVDGIHFLLSLGLCLGVEDYSHRVSVTEKDLSLAILNVYDKGTAFQKEPTVENYSALFGEYLNLLPLLGYDFKEVIDAYKKKMEVNHLRQKNNY